MITRPTDAVPSDHQGPGSAPAGEAPSLHSAHAAVVRVLVVDDDAPMRDALSRILERGEYRCAAVASVAEARESLRASPWDLVICDVRMPEESGLSLVQHIRREHPATPIVMISGIDDPYVAKEALDLGAYGYVTKPFGANQVLIAVANATRRAQLEAENRAYREHLHRMVSERTTELADTLASLQHAQEALQQSTAEAIALLARAIEGRDVETGRHIERMSRYSALLAHHIGIAEERCQLIRLASGMHDVGKLGVPDGILLKPGKLTPAEFAVVKQHSEIGHRILSNSDQPLVLLAAVIARSHHERWDGRGYPDGLRGEEIPLEGRITAITDVFDALLSRRVYKAAFPLEQAVSVMREGRAVAFDPEMLDAFLDHLDEAVAVGAELPDD